MGKNKPYLLPCKLLESPTPWAPPFSMLMLAVSNHDVFRVIINRQWIKDGIYCQLMVPSFLKPGRCTYSLRRDPIVYDETRSSWAHSRPSWPSFGPVGCIHSRFQTCHMVRIVRIQYGFWPFLRWYGRITLGYGFQATHGENFKACV